MHPVSAKLHSRRGGLTRAAAILLVLIAIMLVVVAIPAWRAYKYRADRLGCMAALKTVRDSLLIEYLGNFEEMSTDDARETLLVTMPGREEYCPAHGNVYLIPDEYGTYIPICGLHGPDAKQRTRLNASYALQELKEALKQARDDEVEWPETLTIVLNGKELECVQTEEETGFKRGTTLTSGYKGIVAFYGYAGTGAWQDVDAEAGEICYFSFADEDHCATWRLGEGWTGDSYAE